MYSIFQTQGGREYMEDEADIAIGFYKNYNYYAIFDGHGGKYVSAYLSNNFLNSLRRHLSQTNNVKTSLLQTCREIGTALLKDPNAFHTGSTALVVVTDPKHIWIANVGDCRVILKKFDDEKVRYEGIQLSRDHKPNDPIEIDRIRAAQGSISQDIYGTWRVGGMLAVARSFGDAYLYPSVTWAPDISEIEITNNMRALILGSDGIWDTVSNNDAVSIAANVIKNNMMYDQQNVINKIAYQISMQAQQKGSADNISIIFVII